MPLFALGISHQTAPVAIRERLAFARDDLPRAAVSLHALPGIRECVILSTCNRTEIYAEGDEGASRTIIDWMHQWHQLSPGQYTEHFYRLSRQACVMHLIKVTAGMDSMVLGEPQIAGQVKQAWQLAQEQRVMATVLDRLFQHAFAAAKRVRSETGIGRNPVTLPFAALKLARQIFGELDSLAATLVGAGEMIEECAHHFKAAGVGRLRVANRRVERARPLADSLEVEALPLAEIDRVLPDSDIVVCSTASSQPILHPEHFRAALKQRRHRPMFVLDLAVPRDVAATVGNLGDVYLYTLDDLQDIVQTGQRQRNRAAGIAAGIVEHEAEVFRRWLNQHRANTTLKALRNRALAERERLLEEARRELAAGRPAEDVLRRLAHRLSNRLLHLPSVRMRHAAEVSDEDLLAAASFFFSPEGEDAE